MPVEPNTHAICNIVYESESCGNSNLYKCRNERKGEVYDKGILMLVSKDLEHSKCDVVVNHYMR